MRSHCHRPGAALLAVSLGFAGCPQPEGPVYDEDELVATFEALHERVYGVYDVGPDRDALHDLLAGSFAGPALTAEYVEHFSTIHNMADDEVRIAVRKVDYADVSVLEQEPGRALLDADWSVGGVVTHQRHSHSRVNRYRAIYTIELQPDDEWRITATAMRNLQRLQSPLSVGWPLGEDLGSGAFLDPVDFFEAGVFTGTPSPNGGPDGDQIVVPAGDDDSAVEFMELEGFWE